MEERIQELEADVLNLTIRLNVLEEWLQSIKSTPVLADINLYRSRVFEAQEKGRIAGLDQK